MTANPNPAPSVVIFNPNSTNPYALEVGAALADAGESVLIHCSDDTTSALPEHVRVARTLAGERGTTNAIVHARRRLLAPLRLVLGAPRNSVIVVAWTKGRWERVLLGLRAALVGRVVVVLHNPPGIRTSSRLSRTEVFLLKRCVVVVHSEWLASRVRSSLKRVRVAVHPPYRTVANLVSTSEKGEAALSSIRTIAFVGQARADKGVHELASIAAESTTHWVLRFIGAGQVSTEIADSITNDYVRVDNSTTLWRPSDENLAHALSECDALLAPYTGVTTSGTMLLALSLGVPVLTYPSEALDENAQVRIGSTPHEIAQLIGALPAPSNSRHLAGDLTEWSAAASASWSAIVKEAKNWNG